MSERDPRQRDRAYLGWVAKLPCVACMVLGRVKWGVHVAHLRAGSLEHSKRQTGKAEKPSDRWTLPLCPPHHVGDRRVTAVSQHDMDELEFWAAFGIDPFQLCIDLYAAYYDGPAPISHGVAIVTRAAAAGRRLIERMPMGESEDTIRARYILGQASGEIPTVALSVQQPWAWLIVNGWKDIENRSWLKRFPPRILVHTGLQLDAGADVSILQGVHPATGRGLNPAIRDAYHAAATTEKIKFGGFVGMVDITGVQGDHDSEWFVGDYGYMLANAQPLPFLRFRGMLGFFNARVSA